MPTIPSPSAVRVERIALLSGSIGVTLSAALAARLGDVRLTASGTVLLLSALARRGPLRPRDLQQLTGLTSGGTTNQLDRLIARGLVTRSHDAVGNDRRAVVVALAPTGRRVVDQIAATFIEHADSVRDYLRALEAELAHPQPGSPRVAAAAPEPDDGGSGSRRDPAAPGTLAGDRVLDALMILSRLGGELRGVLIAGLRREAIVSNEAAIVLGELARGGSRRPRDLGALLGTTSGGTTKLLARLEAAGLVALDRGHLEADRRATIVSLTRRGRRALAVSGAALDERSDAIRGLIRDAAALLET